MKRGTPLKRSPFPSGKKRKPRPSLTEDGRIPATETKRPGGAMNAPGPAQEELAPMQDRPYRRTGTCSVCGVEMDAGYPSAPRKTCGQVACVNEAKSRAKRGANNPMKRPETRQRVSNIAAAKRAHDDAAVPGQRRTVCARPACPNLLAGQAHVYCSSACHYADRKRRGGGLKRTEQHHRCQGCGDIFVWNGRGIGVYCSAKCSTPAGAVKQYREVVKVVELRGCRRADWNVELGSCVCGAPAVNRHHIVFEQHVLKANGDRWNPANQLQLCGQCHADLHHKRNFPLAALRDENYEFAEELLGTAAEGYLRRYYAGDDARLEGLDRYYKTTTREAA